jgi:hypothetical protein
VFFRAASERSVPEPISVLRRSSKSERRSCPSPLANHGRIAQVFAAPARARATRSARQPAAGRADEAATAASRLIAMQPDFHLSSFRHFASGFARKDMIDWLSSGIRKAGLPE